MTFPSDGIAAPTILGSDLGFTEGPVITPNGTVYVTSITHGRVYRVDETGPQVHAEVGGGANGATLGSDGTLYIAQNGGRFSTGGPRWGPDSVGGVQALAPDGTVSWVTRDPIAPNDLCLGPDGLLYVTDPTRSPSQDDGRIWRVDPRSGEAEILASVPWFPNGIGFGPEDELYVASTFQSRILRYDPPGERLGIPEVVIEQKEFGMPDGFALDVDGNLLIGALSTEEGRPGEIQIWSPKGDQLGTYAPGAGVAYTNVALGPDGRLVIAGSTDATVLSVDWPVGGLPLHPFR